jgi:hypothetical protein
MSDENQQPVKISFSKNGKITKVPIQLSSTTLKLLPQVDSLIYFENSVCEVSREGHIQYIKVPILEKSYKLYLSDFNPNPITISTTSITLHDGTIINVSKENNKYYLDISTLPDTIEYPYTFTYTHTN